MSDLTQKSVDYLKVLSSASLKDFCDGYRWMFERDFQSSFISSETIATAEFGATLDSVVAVNNLAYAGENSGSGIIQIILEKEAVFSLGGVTVMLPLPRIKEDCQKGAEEDAVMLADAVGEVGNLLTGSFGKVFRDGVPDYEGMQDPFTMHLRLPIYIGKSGGSQLLDAPTVHVFTYEIVLNELAPFRLKVVFSAS